MNHGSGTDFYSYVPTIDKRTKTQLIQQLKTMAPYYASEWRFSPEDPDLGTALSLMFVHLLEGNIKRLNQVPYKSFLAFLNHLNVELAPAKPAMAQITFRLAEGTPNAVLLDSGVQLAADMPEEEEPIRFETVAPLLLTTANLLDVISVQPRLDRIVMLSEEGASLIGGGAGSALFNAEGVNLQEHTLYLRHDFLFKIHHPAFVELTLFQSQNEDAALESAQWLADSEQICWEYNSGDRWHRFDRVYSHRAVVRLVKLNDWSMESTLCHDVEGHWIRCRALNMAEQYGISPLNKVQFDRMLLKSEYAAATDDAGIWPDRLFFNDVQLETEEPCLPFGEYFAPYGLFYISNNEAFSKRGARIHIRFDAELIPYRLLPDKPRPINWKPIMKREVVDAVDVPDAVTIASLHWEYWNGRSWAILPVASEARTIFQSIWDGRQEFDLVFICPEDIEQMVVNAEENFWIRARILQVNNAYSSNAVYYSPQIDRLRIRYGYEKPLYSPQQLLTYNNMDLADRTVEVQFASMPIKPFLSLEGKYPAVWLGFDAPPERGPIHLYIELKQRQWTEREALLIEWEYLKRVGSKSVWTSLQVADDTNGFTRSGCIQFVGPQDFALHDQFGKSRYWIRAVCRDNRMMQQQANMNGPRAMQMLLNTALAVQQTTIVNEFPRRQDVIDRLANESKDYYVLSNSPVLSEEVWVDETDELLPGEIEQLRQQGLVLDIVHDSENEIMRVWVQYTAVEQFLSSGPMDRHYRIDRATGRLAFGDGKIGKLLPRHGADIVRVTYRSGGGERGNVQQGAIHTLQNSIAFIDSVTNHSPASGGCDIGEIDEAIMRGPKRFTHRNRAVTAEDFEWLTREAHPNVAKVKCLPNINVKLEKELGALSIVILPKSGAGHGAHFQELKRTVEASLLAKTSAGVAFPGKVQVMEPALLEIGVQATIWVRNMDDVVPVERELLHRLNLFLDPIKGYTTGTGWEIGQHVHHSMFYALMKSVGPIVHIPQLALDVYKVENGERIEWNPDRIVQLPHSIVVPGAHRLIVELHK